MPANSTTRWLRSIFRFRLRTLLVLMLLVSVACGYLGKHLYRKSIERPIVARIEAAGGQVSYDYQRAPDLSGYNGSAIPPGFPLIRRLLGDDVFASVEAVWLTGSHADADVRYACELPALKGIYLYGNQITDQCVSALQTADRLEHIVLSYTAISPEGILSLQKLPQLQHFTVMEGAATTIHVQAVATLPHLETLQIIRSDATGLAIESLNQVKLLDRLELLDCANLDDTELKGLQNLRALRSLKLFFTSATGEVLKSIAPLTQLEYLFIEGLPLTDADVHQLSSLSKLEVLDISGTNLGDGGVAVIAGLSKLRHLDLAETKVSDVSAPDLDKLRSLQYLDVEQTQITDVGLKQLKSLINLKHFKLDIGTGRAITLAGAQEFQRDHPGCQVECIEYFPDGTSAVIDLATGEIKTF